MTHDNEINAAHPVVTKLYDLHNEAMMLVGERHAKSDLVDLVNWLLYRLSLCEQSKSSEKSDEAGPVRKFLKLAQFAEDIIKSDARWDTKYDLILGESIQGKVRALGIELDEYYSDGSYEEDTLAHMAVLRRKAVEYQSIIDTVEGNNHA